MRSNQVRTNLLGTACFLLSVQGMTQIGIAAAPADACTVLSQQDVATALGVEVDAGQHKLGPGDCRWTQPGKPGTDVAVLQINLTQAQAFGIGKTPIPSWNKTAQTGIGDEAYYVDNGKVTFLISPTLSVKKGTVFFVIAAKIPKASLEQTKAIEKAVAVKVVGNV